MKIRPYLTFNGDCNDAIKLYEKAFKAKVLSIMFFSDLPNSSQLIIPDDYKNKVLQCTMEFGDEFIRLSDCGPNSILNDPESERISLGFEASIEEIKDAFKILEIEGKVGMPLEKTFYSPLAGVVFDKFGVMWNLYAVDETLDKKKHSGKKAIHRWKKELSSIEFYINSRDSKAIVVWQKRNEIVIKKGAKLMPKPPLNKDGSLGFAAKMGITLREDHQDKIANFVTIEDIILKSVNEVGLFLYFGGTNSWLELIDKNGKTINDWAIVE